MTGRAPDTLRAYLIAVLVEMLAVNAFIEFGNVEIPYSHFFGFATALGGFALGLGMVLAMGCAGSVFYRAGEGKFDYVVVIAAYGLSAWITATWFLAPIRQMLGGEGMRMALPRALGLDRWITVAVIVLAVLLWFIRDRNRIALLESWGAIRTGIALGIVGALAWITSTMIGQPSGLGTVEGSANIAELILRADLSALDWHFFLVVTIPLGSYIASARRGKSSSLPIKSNRVPQAILGGALMGVGATIAGGDNIFHGLAGVPILALSSIVVMVFIFA
ncbi:MAG: YeeE/YedE family protein, partial [Anaerolineales bacterium]|nr:YeeE/YedE family protein [Anaerolineales bacterium]